MASQVESDPQAVTTLVSGIIDDARQLFVQQMTLFQVELKHDFRRTMAVCIPMIAGVLVCFVATIILAVAVSFLLCWIWPELPLWGGFGIIGGILALGGVGLIYWGKEKFDTSTLLPKESVEGLKENIQWKTKK